MAQQMELLYPATAYFAREIGWIEIGHNYDGPLTSFLRAIDMGGMVWEGEDSYATMDEAFQDMERGLAEWMREVGIEMD